MEYSAIALSEKGVKKKNNQDGVCIKIANQKKYGQIAMGVICDGMGGFSKGELASATLVRAFSNWFVDFITRDFDGIFPEQISTEWQEMIEHQNSLILRYGELNGIRLGTTVSAILLAGNEYIIAHVGDSRIYQLTNVCKQLTGDHTFVQREVLKGNLTKEEAKNDSRRNILLQCVGAAANVEPDIKHGKITADTFFILCSDGLYHSFSLDDFKEKFDSCDTNSIGAMRKIGSHFIKKAKLNGEKDDISIAIIQCKG